jgi:predicted CoA-binding protein
VQLDYVLLAGTLVLLGALTSCSSSSTSRQPASTRTVDVDPVPAALVERYLHLGGPVTSTLEAKVHEFLAQKRIAVAGVSRDRSHHPVGNLIYQRLKNTGHDVFPVNPNVETFEGDRCYPNLQSIPGGVDGVVIVTRPEVTERIVQQCSDAGVRRVWMHQSVRKGSSVSKAAVEYCRQHDISVIAGACPMMYGAGVDFGHACMRTILRLTGGLPK